MNDETTTAELTDDKLRQLVSHLAMELRDGVITVEGLAQELGAAINRTTRRRAPSIADIISEAVRETDMRANGERRMVPLPWSDLRELHGGGLRPGLHVLTGGSGVGKTGFALRVALEAARDGIPVLYAGLELDNVSVTARLAAQVDEKTPWGVFDWPTSRPHLDLQEIRRRFVAALDELRELPIVVSDPPAMGWTTDDLQSELESVREQHKDQLRDGAPILVVVDFLQLMGPTGDPDDRDLRGRIRRAAYTARQLTRSHDVCVLLVSSVARENYPRLTFDVTDKTDKNAGKAPDDFIGMGKESGEIEYAAHSVTTLCNDKTRSGGVWAVLAKNRTGLVGYTALMFKGAQGVHHDGEMEAREDAKRINSGEPLTTTDGKTSQASSSGATNSKGQSLYRRKTRE